MDREMMFASEGFKLAQVTAVALSSRVLLDDYTRMRGHILDNNNQFSSITAQHMAIAVSIGEVRGLAMVITDSILVGYNLEANLTVLQLLQGYVEDTALLFKALQHHHCQRVLGLPAKWFKII